MSKIRTSHVGSFPLDYSYDNVKRVILDMHQIKLEVPPYPQLHNFIELYLKPLEYEKCLQNNKGLFFVNLANVECLTRSKIRVAEAEESIDIINHHGISFKALRAPVTGPFTLASRVYTSEDISKGLSATSLSRKELVLNFFSKFVINVISYMNSLGYNVIFIDEPVFNYIIGRKKILFGYTDDEVLDILHKATSSRVGVEFGIHICGKLNTKIIELLMQVPKLKYISVELHDSPSNLELLSKDLFEKYDKYLSPGIVSAQKTYVESVDEALSILMNAYEKVGGRVDLVSGDCGFGGLKGSLGYREKEYSIALSKLKIVVEAVDRVRKRLGL
ncbi:MAG: methionine synthase [Ignisphaera sp.]